MFAVGWLSVRYKMAYSTISRKMNLWIHCFVTNVLRFGAISKKWPCEPFVLLRPAPGKFWFVHTTKFFLNFIYIVLFYQIGFLKFVNINPSRKNNRLQDLTAYIDFHYFYFCGVVALRSIFVKTLQKSWTPLQKHDAFGDGALFTDLYLLKANLNIE